MDSPSDRAEPNDPYRISQIGDIAALLDDSLAESKLGAIDSIRWQVIPITRTPSH